MLKAIGKFIDTLPLKHLLSLEESQADTVIIEVDRYYNHHDLMNFVFVMRGVTESGTETQTELAASGFADEDTIRLTWNISSLFTTEPGTLFLDLLAYQYEDPETDASQNPPDYILRYQLPPVQIRDIPKGTSEATDQDNYTAFWIQVKTALSNLQTAVAAQSAQIQELQNRISILVMTKAEYDELDPPDPNTLYVLTDA